MNSASYKDRKAVATALQAVFTSVDAEATEAAADLHHKRDQGAQLENPPRRPNQRPLPSDEAAANLIYPALNATSTERKRSVREWHARKSQFAIMFEGRFPMA